MNVFVWLVTDDRGRVFSGGNSKGSAKRRAVDLMFGSGELRSVNDVRRLFKNHLEKYGYTCREGTWTENETK